MAANGNRARQGNWLLPILSSMTIGEVDAMGFLPLGGLLTAHITGTLVVP